MVVTMVVVKAEMWDAQLAVLTAGLKAVSRAAKSELLQAAYLVAKTVQRKVVMKDGPSAVSKVEMRGD